jgi:hypothetical protein
MQMNTTIRPGVALAALLALASLPAVRNVLAAPQVPPPDTAAYWASLTKAQGSMQSGDYAGAVEEAGAAERLLPGRADALCVAAYSLLRLGRMDEAEKAARDPRAVATESTRPVVETLLDLIARHRTDPSAKFGSYRSSRSFRDAARKLAASPRSSITGVIIVAKGLGVERDMAPKIRRQDGSEVWGTVKLTPEAENDVLDRGIVVYTHSIEEARKCDRAGRFPLIIDAVAAKPAGLITDPEISDSDAEQLLRCNRRSGFLELWNVTFVIDH